MGIRENIIQEASTEAEGKTVSDVRIGLGYTSVLLDSGEMGLAYTWQSDPKTECTVFKGMRPLAGKPVMAVIEMLSSEDTLANAIALAAANAVLNNRKQEYVPGDLVKTMNITPSDTVCMIGAFMPVIAGLKERVASLHVFERNVNMAGDFLPAEQAVDYLPNSNVVIVTSTSILNSTIDTLLQAAENCREIVMLGASTPLCAKVFAGTPVTALSGVVVADREAVARDISEGGGMKIFKDHVKKVTLKTR